jgi:ABC-type transport system involved in cytochrome c biogenesis permease subunit
MDLISLENLLDNLSFLVLFVTMLVYWTGAAFPTTWLASLGTVGVAIANLCMAALLGARWLEAGYFPLAISTNPSFSWLGV